MIKIDLFYARKRLFDYVINKNLQLEFFINYKGQQNHFFLFVFENAPAFTTLSTFQKGNFTSFQRKKKCILPIL